MAVKLLQKSELAKEKARERSREIQEGVKIATRVDGLRELYSKTEQDLEAYKTATLTQLTEEIKKLNDEKERAAANLKEIEDKLERTLSKTEQRALEDLKKSIEAKEKYVSEQSLALDIKEIDIAVALKDSKEALERNKANEILSQRLKAEAEQDKVQAQNALRAAQQAQESAMKAKEEAERYFEMREAGIKSKEDAILRQQVENERIARENAIEKIKITDQWAQLQRTADNLRKLRNG